MTDSKTVTDPAVSVDETPPPFAELFLPVIIGDEVCVECSGTRREYDGTNCWCCGGRGWTPVVAQTRPAGEPHSIAPGFSPSDAVPFTPLTQEVA